MLTYNDLRKNLKKGSSHLPVIKSVLLGDTSTQFLAVALQGIAIERGYKLDLFEADYNQVEHQALSPDSEFHTFEAKYTIIFQSTRKLMDTYDRLTPVRRSVLAEERIEFVKQICSTRSNTIIYCNYPEMDDTVFGGFANKVRKSFLYQIRKLNYELMEMAVAIPNLFICDLAMIQSELSRNFCFDSSLYVNGDMVLSLESLPCVAARMMDIICACQGSIKKCVIVDLDNTLWGGVIGDDGIEGIQVGHGLGNGKIFTEFQHWLKKLKERGIILAVCSKNNEEMAKEPFLKHPEMVLRLDDIAVFSANWENKVDNIRRIQSILNIGFDSMVFLDDSPVERAIVRKNIQGITVPELPEDPADNLRYLYSLNLFETISFLEENAERTKLYQEEYVRTQAMAKFNNEIEFLNSLEMKATVKSFEPFDFPRIAELSQRSNQFNLRTVRYTEADVLRLSRDENYKTFTFQLKDKYGDYGLICFVVLKKLDNNTLFIENWIMSCRVFKRGIEHFVMNSITSYANEHGYNCIIGEYLPTEKNKIVAEHYGRFGFIESEKSENSTAQYFLQMKHTVEFNCQIEKL